MTISFVLGPQPRWIFNDLTGRPLGGGSMATYRSLDKTQKKFVFEDPAGNFPWPDPVLFDANGMQGPFYWEVDTLNPQETYYIEVYDSQGVLQFTQDDYLPNGGGGSIVTEDINIENLVINNVMWRNIGATANPISSTFTLLAPGPHAGFAETTSNAGPDIYLIKNNTAATDQIQFLDFILGTQPLIGDVAPVQYLNYVCTNTPAGETLKAVQYPITAKVQNLTNIPVTLSIWARGNSGTITLTLYWRTFFGDGAGASPDLITPIQTLTLNSNWTQFVINSTVPDVTGKVLGACGNDALFLQVGFPLGASCNIDFAKPSMFLGQLQSPTLDFLSYDEIDGMLNVPRTGWVSQGYDLASMVALGFIPMNDGTIGSATSGATTRANQDTFPLYNLLWNNVSFPSSNVWAPVTGGLGASSIADFTANKPMALTRALGRVLGSAGSGAGLTPRVLGQFLGEETHQLTVPEMPSHSHTVHTGNSTTFTGSCTNSNIINGSFPTGSTGGDQAHNNMQPTSFLNFYIKL